MNILQTIQEDIKDFYKTCEEDRYQITSKYMDAEVEKVKNFRIQSQINLLNALIEKMEGEKKCEHEFRVFEGTCHKCGTNRSYREFDYAHNTALQKQIYDIRDIIKELNKNNG